MKVLLTQNIDKLGRRGEVKTVSDGYARNYLLPKKLALKPTSQNIKQLETESSRRVQEEVEQKKTMEQAAEQLKQTSCTVTSHADENGHLYGSVTEAMIAEALKEEGAEVEAKTIVLHAPIKELGVYDIEVRLHPDVIVQTRVWVVEEKGKTGEDKAE
ncbi:MAG: 50S ribosomal protein L9 [Planctomycetota bacterium]